MKKIKKNEHSKEWHEQRRKGIGGSDAGAVCGLNRYKSPYTLWCEKTGRISDEIPDNERMRLGRDLEDYVASRFTEETGLKTRKTNFSYQSEEHPFMLANIDRWVIGVEDQKVGLEIKTMNDFYAKTVGVEEGFIPDSYYAQCYHYMAVTGADGWYIAILVLGKSFEVFYIPRDECEIQALIDQERTFWEMVEKDIEPPIDGSSSTADTLKIQYPQSIESTDIELLRSKDVLDYIRVCDQLKELKDQKDELENIFKSDMQEVEKAHCGPLQIIWKSGETNRFDQTAFKKAYPDLYKNFIKTSKTRTFRTKISD